MEVYKSDLWKLHELLPSWAVDSLVRAIEEAANIDQGRVVITLEGGKVADVKAENKNNQDSEKELLRLIEAIPPQSIIRWTLNKPNAKRDRSGIIYEFFTADSDSDDEDLYDESEE